MDEPAPPDTVSGIEEQKASAAEEAAALLGVSTKTVQRRWQEGCVRLHKALGGRLPGM